MDYTNRNRFSNQSAASQSSTVYDAGLRSYMLMVYNYMAGALGVTGLVAYITAHTPVVMQAIYGTPLQWVVMLAPIGLVLFMGFRLEKMSLSAVQGVFWTFSVLMGLSLSSIFLIYTGMSIAKVFFITATVFASMSIYGYTTKKDLTGMGAILMMGLIGIIIASLVNIFLQSPAMDFAISIIGVLVFVGLTAYDTQKMKHMYYALGGTSTQARKVAIMGATSLYLDFINLMIMLLRLFGERR